MQSNTAEGNAPASLRTPLRRHRARTSPYGMERSTPQERSPSQDRERRLKSEEDRPEAEQTGDSVPVRPLVRAAAVSSTGAGQEATRSAPAETLVTDAASTTGSAAASPQPDTLQTNEASTGAQPVRAAPDDLFELDVRPLVKQSVSQRDRSGEAYRHEVFTGNSFNSIMAAIWEKYAPIVKHRAVKMNGVWSVETPELAAWSDVMQFKVEKRLVTSNKDDEGWSEWLTASFGKTVTLMIYDYGMGIVTAKDRDAFLKACILPRETDRAGATAESSLREVVEALQQKWGAESRLEAHLTDVAQSSNVALDCVRASIEDCHQLRGYLDAARRYLDDQEQRLVARESIIEGIIRDLAPPSASEVIDPLPLIENIEDTEHAA
ncbi:hypothetical protein AM587_10000532 [Phytophthora nicotianae]|uniref:Uncharacterized protein n=1 Tax=Phytophthora nicotianae TaxID=4792 RepID=A0A0W8CK44_PHYNI|nr:hypothetical protein AM587_10000532 [Phytophthora nicotianae]